MAWMACHLFVRSAELEPVVEGVVALLADAQHAADRGGVLDPPGGLFVSPSVEGWVVICGARGWLDDLGWAASALAARLGAEAASLELFGNCYRLRAAECDRTGARTRLVLSPADGWGDESDGDAPMARYEDVEASAYAQLRALGVPAVLLAVGTRPLGRAAEPELRLGEGVALTPAPSGGRVGRLPRPLLAAAFSGDDPPFLPLERGGAGFGEVQAEGSPYRASPGTRPPLILFDERYVEGVPSDAAVDRLLEIEAGFLARAGRICPDHEVSLTVTYHAGAHQDRLDDFLRARGRPTSPSVARERPPWWQFWRHLGKAR
jgi:hypothetical protein